MCNPAAAVAVASVVASVAGTTINQRNQNQAIEAQNKANREAVQASTQAADQERVRQKKLEDESTASLQRALQGSAEVAEGTGREEETTAALTAQNEAVRPELTASALPGQISGDTELAQIITGQIGESAERTNTQLQGLNTLAGLQSAFGGLSDLFQGTGGAIGTTNSNRRASLGVSGLETGVSPALARPSNSPVGDLFLLGGQALGSTSGSFGGGGDIVSAGNTFQTPTAAQVARFTPIELNTLALTGGPLPF